jgi:hypothetical protein
MANESPVLIHIQKLWEKMNLPKGLFEIAAMKVTHLTFVNVFKTQGELKYRDLYFLTRVYYKFVICWFVLVCFGSKVVLGV